MSIDRLYRVPCRLDQKTTLPEITYLFAYLSDEKKFLSGVYSIISSLERFYRSSAQTFISATEMQTESFPDLPVASGFRRFRQTRLNQARRFFDIAQRIAGVLNTDIVQVTAAFKTMSVQITADLTKLQMLVQSPLDGLYASISGYNKYFKQLQQCNVNSQQAVKSLRALDEKLVRVRNNHCVFRHKFLEYCGMRESVFMSVQSLVNSTNTRMMGILSCVSDIEGPVLGDLSCSVSQRLSLEEQQVDTTWPEEEELEETEPPFLVRLGEPLSIGGVLLPVNLQLTVLESRGRIWKLKDDKRNCIWLIAQDFLLADDHSK
jgi:hypothetical protein